MIRWATVAAGALLLAMGPLVASMRCGHDPARRSRETHRVINGRAEPVSNRRAR